MRITRNAVALAGVAAVAFAAGHIRLGDRGPTARADDKPQQELDPRMQACLDAGTPGQNHKYLDALIGHWDGVYRMWMEPGADPMEFRGTVDREWILGNRYVKEKVEATSEMGTFTGLGFIAYNNVDGQYEIAWLDSMSTGIYHETGTYDPDKKVLSTRSSHRDPATGRLVTGWGTLDLSNPDRQAYVGYAVDPEGRPFKAFEGTTVRQKK
jgi:hypothetical protein